MVSCCSSRYCTLVLCQGGASWDMTWGRWAGRDDALDHAYVSSGFALDRAAKTLACRPRQTSGSACTPRTQCQRPRYASWSANEAQAGRHTQSRIPRTPCGVPQLSGRPPGTGVLDSMHPWHCQAVPAHDKQTDDCGFAHTSAQLRE
jgi:hypothetical protein